MQRGRILPLITAQPSAINCNVLYNSGLPDLPWMGKHNRACGVVEAISRALRLTLELRRSSPSIQEGWGWSAIAREPTCRSAVACREAGVASGQGPLPTRCETGNVMKCELNGGDVSQIEGSVCTNQCPRVKNAM